MPWLQINPLVDDRWHDLLARHPAASPFHTRGWLAALQQTYGYKPVAFTTSDRGEALNNGVVFCEVSSWATGRRLVSLPFSDHCDPLIDDGRQLSGITAELAGRCVQRGWRYIELRPRSNAWLDHSAAFKAGEEFWFHTLDLRKELPLLLQSCHPDCIRRKIRRAEREGLHYERGRSTELLEQFYRLLIRTRRRHSVAPQPVKWFANLQACFGEHLEIRVASKNGRPLAAILTLSFRKVLVYKYGCSDESLHNLGGMPWLFWRAIEEAKASGLEEFDLGRCDRDNPGLAAFKERLGATRGRLCYLRHPVAPGAKRHGWIRKAQSFAFAHMPDRLLSAAGRLLYPHLG